MKSHPRWIFLLIGVLAYYGGKVMGYQEGAHAANEALINRITSRVEVREALPGEDTGLKTLVVVAKR
jgi:hypothetical protein